MTRTDLFPVIPGFEIQGVLGRGTTSTVYRATRGHLSVAVKVMQVPGGARPSPEDALRFRREAASLARLRHVGLLGVLEVGEVDGIPYLVTELIEGRSLAERIAEIGRLPEAEVLSIARVLAGALVEVHRKGVVHRDLKPQNILIDPSGAPKFIDFGLAAQDRASKPAKDPGAAVGTFLYSPPEQTGMLARPVDGRSDLYSLGVVLHEALSGTPPFRSEDLAELLRLHATVTPPSPGAGVSPAFQAILSKLLAKDPDDRYASAAALLADLECVATLKPNEVGAREPRQHPELPLVGRDAELAQLLAAWTDAAQARGGVFLVEGEPGSGKSRLVRELQGRAGENTLLLRGKCSPDGRTPLAFLREAIEGRLRKALPGDEKRIREALGEHVTLVSEFSPALRKLLGIERAASPRDANTQQAFYHALAGFLCGLAKEGPVLLVVDDVQWLDEASLEVLRLLSAQARNQRLLIACTTRSDERSIAALEAFAQTVGSGMRGRLRLGALSEKATTDLLSAHLGGGVIPAELSRKLHRRSNGSPFELGEHVFSMLDATALRPHWGEWVADSASMASLDLGEDVLQLVMRRAMRLSEASRTCLAVAALIGNRFDARFLGAVLQGSGSEGDLTSALEESVAINLIEAAGREYSFVHDRVREAFLAHLDQSGGRASWHLRIAMALEKSGPGPALAGGPYAYALAHHYSNASQVEPRRLFEVTAEAGKHAKADFAEREAYRYFSRSLGHAQAAGITPDREFFADAGSAALAAEQDGDCQAWITRAIELQDDRLEKAALRMHLLRLRMAEGDLKGAYRELETAYEELGSPLSRSVGRKILGTLGDWIAGVFIEKTGIGYGTAKGRERRYYEVQCLLDSNSFGTAFFELQMGTLMQIGFRALKAAHRLGPSPEAAAALGVHACTITIMGMKAQALGFSRQGRSTAERIGDPLLVGQTTFHRAGIDFFAGPGPEALEQYRAIMEKYGTLLGVDHYVMTLGSLVWLWQLAGFTREEAEFCVREVRALKAGKIGGRAGPMARRALAWSCTHAMVSLATQGRMAEAAEMRALHDSLGETQPFDRALHQMNLMAFYLEQGELGAPVEEAIAKMAEVRPTVAEFPVCPRPFWAYLGYIQLERVRRASAAALPEERKKLQQCLKLLRQAVGMGSNPILRCHGLVIDAIAADLNGDRKQARKFLAHAEELSRQENAPLVFFEIHRLRARMLLQEKQRASAEREARIALDLAHRHGWANRQQWILTEFGLSSQSLHSSHGSTSSGPSHRSGSSSIGTSLESVKLRRQMDVLMQLSLSSVKIVDPGEKARQALDETLRLLGGERAFLFLWDEATASLRMEAGRDAASADLPELRGYSGTVVKQVCESGQALVVSGTEDGQVQASESVVAHGLRSIIAAPVKMRDRLVGVIYLDSRLAKGIFTQDDVEILEAIGNHVALSVENARAACVEMEKQAMAKDLEVSHMVQTLLLPSTALDETAFGELTAFYRSAAQSGGDWWWYEKLPGDRYLVLLGDVTGHGVGAAMVTAVVAASFHAIRKNHGDLADCARQVPELIEGMSRSLWEICRGKYNMTLVAIEVDCAQGRVRTWNAGHPSALVLGSDGNVDSLFTAGTLLGSEKVQLGFRERELHEGEGVLVFTDGAYELNRPDGRALKLKGFHGLVQSLHRATSGEGLERLKGALVSELDGFLKHQVQEDDQTFVLIRRKAASAQRKREAA